MSISKGNNAIIQSNMFKLEEGYEDNIKNIDFHNTNNEVIQKNKIIEIKKEFSNAISEVLCSCKGYVGANHSEIILNHQNFPEYHYDIMNNRFLVVMYDFDNSKFKYMTSSGTVYITSDPKVIKIINTVPIPYKISLDYIPSIDGDKIKNIRLLNNILFNSSTSEPLEIIKPYLKNNIDILSDSEYSINYYLFSIYPKLEYQINKFNYWKLLNFEQTIFNISNEINCNSLINFDYINLIEDNIIKKLQSFITDLNLNITTEEALDNSILFDAIYKNTNLYISINEEFSKLLNYDNFTSFISELNNYKLISYIKKYSKLPEVNTYNNLGIIDKSNKLIINSNISTKRLIRGSYNDLFFKILISLLHNKKYKSILNSDNKLFETLLEDIITNKEELKIKSYLIENTIKANLLGYTSDDDLFLYFEKYLSIIISEDDLNYIKETINSNLKEFIKLISEYNSTNTNNDKTIFNRDLTALGMTVLNKIRLIQKNLITEINNYCIDFNSKNKDKMNIFFFDDEYIYMCADETSFNVAFDTLSRVMPLIFNRFCPSMSASCNIEVIE